MKKTASFIGFLTVLVVSFQNCSQRNFETQSSADKAGTSLSKSGAQASTDFDKLTLWDNQKQQILDVDLATGAMVAFEDYGNAPGGKYCLTAAELSELKTILANSTVCVPDLELKNANSASGQMCSMVYQYPYASLANSKEEVRLGEKTSGCDEPADLCGDRGAMLKNFATSVLKNLDQKTCL